MPELCDRTPESLIDDDDDDDEDPDAPINPTFRLTSPYDTKLANGELLPTLNPEQIVGKSFLLPPNKDNVRDTAFITEMIVQYEGGDGAGLLAGFPQTWHVRRYSISLSEFSRSLSEFVGSMVSDSATAIPSAECFAARYAVLSFGVMLFIFCSSFSRLLLSHRMNRTPAAIITPMTAMSYKVFISEKSS